jgi:hypothetical protein
MACRKQVIFKSLLSLAVVFVTELGVDAQGTTTFISNVGQASAGSSPVGSDSWLAAAFHTGPSSNGYLLDSVQLNMADAAGNPNGFTVMLYLTSGLAIAPGSKLGTLTGSADPATSGTYVYTASSSLTLLPSTIYFVVMTDGTAAATGAYDWDYAAGNNYNPNGVGPALPAGGPPAMAPLGPVPRPSFPNSRSTPRRHRSPASLAC